MKIMALDASKKYQAFGISCCFQHENVPYIARNDSASLQNTHGSRSSCATRPTANNGVQMLQPVAGCERFAVRLGHDHDGPGDLDIELQTVSRAVLHEATVRSRALNVEWRWSDAPRTSTDPTSRALSSTSFNTGA